MTPEQLLTASAVRKQAEFIFQLTEQGHTHFQLDLSQMESCADFVISVIHKNYPRFDIPYHSRWNHMRHGNPGRLSFLDKSESALEKFKLEFELTLVSVLLDAGAGDKWTYFENESQQYFNRSEGLGVASVVAFKNGAFSSQGVPAADRQGLLNFSEESLKKYFQVTSDNPLNGTNGRTELINKLAQIIPKGRNRLGDLATQFLDLKENSASQLFEFLVKTLNPIWPKRLILSQIPMGDTWEYLNPKNGEKCFIPFHKLTFWLTYSLIEVFERYQPPLSKISELTGLPEYRNGGLFLDFGVLKLKDLNLMQKAHHPSDAIIVEWRALTVTCLDLIAKTIWHTLNKTPETLPLAKILEGGTWHAGREIAKQKRAGGTPPLQIESDGTVF